MTDLTTAAREMHELLAALAAHTEAAKHEDARLREEIRKRQAVLSMSADGIDTAKVALAKTIIYATDYSHGGDDRASCRADAIKQLSTGAPVRNFYGDLWHVAFGTKNYDRWRGQRCDCEYGCGPGHGSICFAIGVTKDARKRTQADLTADEIEAAIYYLVNLERIQAAEADARAKASAA